MQYLFEDLSKTLTGKNDGQKFTLWNLEMTRIERYNYKLSLGGVNIQMLSESIGYLHEEDFTTISSRKTYQIREKAKFFFLDAPFIQLWKPNLS